MRAVLLASVFLLSISFVNGQNVGIGTPSPKAKLHVADSSVLFTATGPIPVSAGNVPVSGEGRRMFWYADRAAFRAGYVNTFQWDRSFIGNYSFATGYGTIASGEASVALGMASNAGGASAMAAGYNNNASGPYAIAIGSGAGATGTNTISIGTNTSAGGMYATALGSSNTAAGNYSTVIGSEASAAGI